MSASFIYYNLKTKIKMNIEINTCDELFCMAQSVSNIQTKKYILNEIIRKISSRNEIIDIENISNFSKKFQNLINDVQNPGKKKRTKKQIGYEVKEDKNISPSSSSSAGKLSAPPSPSQPSAVKKRKIVSLEPSQELGYKICEVCANDKIQCNKWTSHIHSQHHLSKLKIYLMKSNQITIINRAFKSSIISYSISNINRSLFNASDFINSITDLLHTITMKYLESFNCLKINFKLHCTFSKIPESHSIKTFNTRNRIFMHSSDFNEFLKSVCSEIQTKAEEFQESESGWSLEEILYLEMNIHKHNPMKASSYIKLPKQISQRGGIINVHNKDQACFAWAVISALYPAKSHCDRTSSYPKYEGILNLNGIEFPMKLKSIPDFEKKNDLSINVFGMECTDGEYQLIGPYHHTTERKQKHINLLFLEDHDGNGHYCWIKNMSRVFSTQLSKHKTSKFICDGCLIYFQEKKLLEAHQKYDCGRVKAILPNEGDQLNFTRLERQMPVSIFINFNAYCKSEIIVNLFQVPFTIYADFEALLQKSTAHETNSTKTTHKHIPYSYGYYLKCAYDEKLSKYVSYRGADCAKHFVKSIREVSQSTYKAFLRKKEEMIQLTDGEKRSYLLSKKCHLCSEEFDPYSVVNCKVRDHCHLTGKFRGAAHKKCNFKFRVPKHIPVFFHNLSCYDSHLFIKEISEEYPDDELTVIPQNSEKYISFSQKIDKYFEIRFLDSYRFMPSSLDTLGKTLDKQKFLITKKIFGDKNTSILYRKGVFPYEHVDSFEKLEEKSLPPIDKFFSSVSQKCISKKDYAFAQKIWKHFDIQSLGAYSDIYLKMDVTILADVFEDFCNICLKIYNLDPKHYYTSPGLSWDAMLKFTKINLDLISDIDMIHFLKKGIRGGISQCTSRHSIANNKYMHKYDPKKILKYLLYLDANNLYGWAMSQRLPYGGFKWLNTEEISKIEINNVELDSHKGYILEVDLEYPSKLHDAHNDLPFCVENIIPSDGQFSKLIGNFYEKKKYVIHINALKQCLEHGVKLNCIHRVLTFNQKKWLEPYIELNTQCRQNAKNDFEKLFFKLMNNSIYGKTMENVENRRNIYLVTNWKKIGNTNGAQNLIARPNFMHSTIFTENFVAIELQKTEIKYTKPIYIGFSVLDISKTLMYKFHYDVMKHKYNDKVKLLYTDTDSFIYEIITADFYDDIKNDSNLLKMLDTSDFCDEYGIKCCNKMKIGKFKDENKGNILEEFVGLRSKVYALKIFSKLPNDHNNTDSRTIIKKAKGVDRGALTSVTLEDYNECLQNGKIKYCSVHRFKSIKHTIFTQEVRKVGLSNADNKRVLIPDSTDTYSWGHYKTI